MRRDAHRRHLVAVVVGLAFWFEHCVAVAQAKDPAVGEWMLSIAKSTFEPDNTLQRRIATFEAVPDGFKHVQETLLANGSISRVEYSAKFDGKDYPIVGSALDTVSVKRIDANTVERSGKVRGQIIETATRVVSADGKTLTITTKGSLDGMDYSSTQVYDRR